MRAFMRGIAGLLLGLTLLGGAVAVAAAQGTHAGVAAQATTPKTTAPPSQSQTCAGQDTTDTAAATGTEANEATKSADTDNIDLQCGDQTGPDTGADSNARAGGARAQMAAVSQGHGLSLLAAQTGHANGAVQAQQTKPATATTEQESASETEGKADTGPDTDTLNVQCDQQGAQGGDNAGC